MIIKPGVLKFDRFTVERSIYAPGLYLPPHTDQNSRISIILKGGLEERTAAENVKATAGSLVIKPNHTVHENFFGPAESTLLSVSFHKDLQLPDGFDTWKWMQHPKIFVLGMNLWLQLQKVKNDKELNLHFTEFIRQIKILQHKEDSKSAWLNTIRQALEDDIADQETIQSLSQKRSLHRVYLGRAFKKQYNISPLEFRKHVKLAAVIRELSLTNNSLSGIAFDTGFSDQSHMNRTLKKSLGYSPDELRKIFKKI